MLNLTGRLLSSPFYKHPIIVVGMGRSGTSILLQALGNHPYIYALPGEAPFLTSMGGSAYLFEYADQRRYYIDSLKVSKNYLFHQLRQMGFDAASGPHSGLKRMLKGLLYRTRTPLGRRFWCAKTFPTENVAQGLAALYPGVRFIYIVRNGCDVVHSRSKFGGFSHEDFKQNCVSWAEGVEKFRYLTQLAQCCFTTHEGLVTDPKRFFSEIFERLGLPEHPGPANYAATTLVHPLDQATHVGTDVRKELAERDPPHTSWTPEQRAMFKEICGQAMSELGYSIPF